MEGMKSSLPADSESSYATERHNQRGRRVGLRSGLLAIVNCSGAPQYPRSRIRGDGIVEIVRHTDRPIPVLDVAVGHRTVVVEARRRRARSKCHQTEAVPLYTNGTGGWRKSKSTRLRNFDVPYCVQPPQSRRHAVRHIITQQSCAGTIGLTEGIMPCARFHCVHSR